MFLVHRAQNQESDFTFPGLSDQPAYPHSVHDGHDRQTPHKLLLIPTLFYRTIQSATMLRLPRRLPHPVAARRRRRRLPRA